MSMRYMTAEDLAALEVFHARDKHIMEVVDKCTKLTREQFKKQIKPADVIIPYKRAKYTAKSGILGRLVTPINKLIQGSSFTSCKLVGRFAKSVIGYGVVAGKEDINYASIDKFLDQHEAALIMRYKGITNAQREAVLKSMYEYHDQQPKYDKLTLASTVVHHWFGTINKKFKDKEFGKYEQRKLICSSLVLKCFQDNNLKVDHDKEVGDKYIWPSEFIHSKSFTCVGGFFSKEAKVGTKK